MDNTNVTPTAKRRLPSRSWLAILGVFLILLIVPSVRWIVVQQAQWEFEGPQVFEELLGALGVSGYAGFPQLNDRQLQERAGSHPREYEVQLGCILLGSSSAAVRVDRLRKLADIFPGRAGLYAHIVRFFMDNIVTINRSEQDNLSGGPPPKMPFPFTPSPPPTSANLLELDRAAKQGERLDPTNAFFPWMRAVGLFAAHHDVAAISEIERAGRDSKWDDYTDEYIDSNWRLYSRLTGIQSSVERATLGATILLPHFSVARAVARMGTYEAIQDERSGRVEQGLEIRRSMMRCGGLIRAHSSTMIGTLAGISMVSIAMTRPGGVPEAEAQPSQTSTQRTKRRQTAYLAYLRKLDHPDEAAWVASEIAADNAARAILRHASQLEGSSSPIFPLISLWLADLVVIANILWFALNGGVARAILRIPRQWLATVGLIVITLGMQVLVAVSLFHWGRDAGYIYSVLAELSGQNGSEIGLLFASIICFVGTLALPVVSMLFFAITAAITHKPPSAIIAKWAPRIVLALSLCYAGLVVLTAQQEARVNTMLDQTSKHEGSYIAQQIGKQWPGVTR